MIDTHAEMVAGYVVATVIYVGYMLSLWLRARRVRERLRATSPGSSLRSE